MAILSGLMANCSGLIHPKLPSRNLKFHMDRCRSYGVIGLELKKIPRLRIQHPLAEGFNSKYGAFVGRNHHELSFDDEFLKEPFWMSWIKEAFRQLKSLLLFLVEQPSQLKYIEWPSFQSTLKTAALTLIIVALLIVALSSVDFVLGYLLALLQRKTP